MDWENCGTNSLASTDNLEPPTPGMVLTDLGEVSAVASEVSEELAINPSEEMRLLPSNKKSREIFH